MAHDGYDDYSPVADQQLDVLERTPAASMYDRILDVVEKILDTPGQARARSAVIVTEQGNRYRSTVPGAYPDKVFWSLAADGTARIEAIFPYR